MKWVSGRKCHSFFQFLSGYNHGSVAIPGSQFLFRRTDPRMAEAIASSEAVKILIPLNRCGIEICGTVDEPLPWQVENLVERVRYWYEKKVTQG